MRNPETFSESVNRLIDWVQDLARQQGFALRQWDEVVVTEEENGVRGDHARPAAAFEPRFSQILASTTRDWVNLHLDAIDGGRLELVVEFISRQDRNAIRVEPGQISVNLSGPEGGLRRIALPG